jgi:hypothetical protein
LVRQLAKTCEKEESAMNGAVAYIEVAPQASVGQHTFSTPELAVITQSDDGFLAWT